MPVSEKKIERVAFGGGCFWCSEAVFRLLKGVGEVTSGYAGGNVPHPSYEQVSEGNTGHAEVVLVEYDPQLISFAKLLDIFFTSHNPTELNRQGNDVGTQYRSIILYDTLAQKDEAEYTIKKLINSGMYSKPIVTELQKLDVFYPAEEYHKDYYAKHSEEGYAQVVIKPKVEKIKEKYKELLVQ